LLIGLWTTGHGLGDLRDIGAATANRHAQAQSGHSFSLAPRQHVKQRDRCVGGPFLRAAAAWIRVS